MPLSRLDELFGGKPGAAEKTRNSMRKYYGRDGGDAVFNARVAKLTNRKRRRAAKDARRKTRG